MLLPDQRPIDDDQLRAAYDWPDPGDRAWVRGLMVMTLDGTFVGPDGKSGSVSGPGDQKVFAASRALSDAYLVGARTIRVEGYQAIRPKPRVAELRAERGQRPAPTLAIVTGNCEFDWSNASWVDSEERPVLLTTETARPDTRAEAAARGCDVVIAGDATVDLGAALHALVTRGLNRVNCEGGPTLLGELIAQDQLDELALTVSPLATHAHVPYGPGAVVLTGFNLDLLLEHDSYLFCRYVRDAARTERAQAELFAEGAGAADAAGAASPS